MRSSTRAREGPQAERLTFSGVCTAYGTKTIFFFLVANLNLFSLCVQPKVGFYGQKAKASPAAVSKGRAGSTSPLGEVTLR